MSRKHYLDYTVVDRQYTVDDLGPDPLLEKLCNEYVLPRYDIPPHLAKTWAVQAK